MKLLGSPKSNITRNENGENVPYLEFTEVVLIHCNVVNNSYQQKSRVLYTFVPNKLFGQLSDISPNGFISLKTFDSEFLYIDVFLYIEVRNMGKNVGKNKSKNLSSQYNQKLFDHAKQSATDAIKTASKSAIEKTAGATGDLIENKIADKITRVSKISTKNNSETNEEEILRERFIPPELRHKIIDDLRLIK